MSFRLTGSGPEVYHELNVTKFEERAIGPTPREGVYEIVVETPMWVKWIPIIGPQVLVTGADRWRIPGGSTLYFTAVATAGHISVSRRAPSPND